ncbi:MAG TPA: ABC transporter permease [Flavobacteriales bacterium]|nr:ABC transporter permease [Flavobacteriales bacterium]
MKFTNLIKLALVAILRNKLRTLLTMLGIIIGVASVIVMLAIGQGSDQSIKKEISGLGTNVVTVRNGTTSNSGVRQESGTLTALRPADADAIKRYSRLSKYVTPTVVTASQLIAGTKNWRSQVYGVQADYFKITGIEMQYGTMFNDYQGKGSSKICVIGETVAENLFGQGVDPTGKSIRIDKLPFKVIGMIRSKGPGLFGLDRDDIVIAPFKTVQRRILSIDYVQQIIVSAIDENSIQPCKDEIERILVNKQHRVKNDEALFVVRTQTELTNFFGTITGVLTVLLASIAFISLIVGGIGIMNIMLVSVTERTREIGIRLAVGAKRKDVLMQFLVESVILCLTGGAIGVLFGTSIAAFFSAVMGWPIAVTFDSILLAFICSSSVGIFFGFYPARKASKLNPVEALRYE